PIPTRCLIAGMRVAQVPNAAAWSMNTAETLNRARRKVGVSSKRFALDVGKPPLDVVGERASVLDQLGREGTCALEQRAVATQMRKLQVRQPGLTRAEQLAAAPQLEIDLRQLESVRRADERLEPRHRRVRELLSRARDQ